MSLINERVYYVVLEGRLRGIYSRWLDCAAQIHGWRGSKYKVFTKFSDALTTFEENNKQPTHHKSFQCKSLFEVGQSSSSSGYKCAYDDIPAIDTYELAPDTASQNTLLRWSMQVELGRAANVLRVEEPRYTRVGDITHEGQHYVRYYVAFNSCLIGRPPVTMGLYARTGYLAREDAAYLMLTRVVAGSGKTILDFNYANEEVLQSRVTNLEIENHDLIYENALLKAECRMLKDNLKLP